MSDLNPDELRTLATRLRAGVPEPPELTGLAGRAESQSRRARRRRAATAVAAAAVLVAAVVTVPRLVGGPAPAHPTPAACVRGAALNHPDFPAGRAVWVLSCPVHPPQRQVPLSSEVLRGAAAARLVRGWQAAANVYRAAPNCGVGSWPGAVLDVGFADGTVAEIDDTACVPLVDPGSYGIPTGHLVRDFTIALQGQDEARYSGLVADRPETCPATLAQPAAMNADGESARDLDDHGPLLDLPPRESLVCRYVHGRLVATSRQRDPGRLLLDTLDGWQADFRTEPLAVRPDGSYLVVLGDQTGTQRTFTLTGRFGRIRLYRGDGTVTVLGYPIVPFLRTLGDRPFGHSTRS